MDLILSRLSPVLLAWLLVALAGIAVSGATLRTMQYEINQHPAALRSPGVAAMKRHNRVAEAVRGLAQLIALLLGVAYILRLIGSEAIAWGLVLMNLSLVGNSMNELILTLRLLGRWRPVSVHTVSRGPTRPAAVQVDAPDKTEEAMS